MPGCTCVGGLPKLVAAVYVLCVQIVLISSNSIRQRDESGSLRINTDTVFDIVARLVKLNLNLKKIE